MYNDVAAVVVCCKSGLASFGPVNQLVFFMNSSDLFSFLDEVPPEPLSGHDLHDGDEMHVDPDSQDSSRLEDVRKKRKIVPDFPNVQDASAVKRDSENTSGPSNLKKPRLASPKPVVVDEFEREAKREVAASAGLTGSVESGTRLELRHQVGVEPANNCSFDETHSRFVTK